MIQVGKRKDTWWINVKSWWYSEYNELCGMGGVCHDKSSDFSVKMYFYFIKNTDIRVINDTKVVHGIKCAVLLLMDTWRQLFFLLVIFLKIPYSDYTDNNKSVTTKTSIIYFKTMMNGAFFSKSIHFSSK